MNKTVSERASKSNFLGCMTTWQEGIGTHTEKISRTAWIELSEEHYENEYVKKQHQNIKILACACISKHAVCDCGTRMMKAAEKHNTYYNSDDDIPDSGAE
jgi:hypothetical protein